MSDLLVDRCFDIQGISRAERIVLMVICRFAADDTLRACPSMPTIAKQSRLSKRQVQRIIPALIRSGHIQREIGKGIGRKSLYTINLAKMPSSGVALR